MEKTVKDVECVSKVNRIKEEIVEMIRLGILGPGEKLPSIRSMAKKTWGKYHAYKRCL